MRCRHPLSALALGVLATFVVALMPPGTALATPPAVPTTLSITGTYASAISEDLLARRSATQPVVTAGGTAIPLPPRLAAGLTGGQQVRLSVAAPAAARSTRQVAAAVAGGTATVTSVTPVRTAAALTGDNAGAHSLIVLPVHWSAPDAQTPDSLRAVAVRTAAYWSEQTDAALTVPTIEVRDWMAIPDPGRCDYMSIAYAARAAAGVASAYHAHVLVYFPRTAYCGWTGLAFMPGDQIWINGYAYGDAWEHEFGHNLGLNHANAAACRADGSQVPLSDTCDTLNYWDYDVMGYARYGDGYTLNAALADYLGLLDAATVATRGVPVTLAPATAHSGLRAVKVPLPGSTLYVEYRPRQGRDAGEPAGWAGVQVHQRLAWADTSRVLALNPDPPGGSLLGAPAARVGVAWTIPGAYLSMVVQQADETGATVRFDSLADATPPPAPAAPAVTGAAQATAPDGTDRVRGDLLVRWSGVTDPESGTAWYDVVVDGSRVDRVGATSTGYGLAALPTGEHTVRVDALNYAGLSTVGTEATFRTDNTAPTAPDLTRIAGGDPSRAPVVGTSFAVGWSAASDADAGMDHYTVALDATVVASAGAGATAATVTVPPTLPSGRHTLTVSAVDRVGLATASAGVPVTLDALAPAVSGPAVSLRAGPAGAGAPVTIEVRGTDGGSGLCTLRTTVDGAAVASGRAPLLRSTLTIAANRTVSVAATATDCAANSASRAVRLRVSSAPETSARFSSGWSTVRSGAYSEGRARRTTRRGASATYQFTGSQVALLGSRAPNGGAAAVYLDGRRVGTVDTAGRSASRQLLWSIATRPGRHTLTVTALGTRNRPGVTLDGFVVLG